MDSCAWLLSWVYILRPVCPILSDSSEHLTPISKQFLLNNQNQQHNNRHESIINRSSKIGASTTTLR
ncbi:hypothetical protein VCRA2119O430_20302 [Vibrio crassostreae]|nr:hypothetical protein VCRA2113O413_20107 [Vibrio crassostreae]CAK1980016.1 hypothetical protein VCRA2114O423_20107 [Vibrio crassostreae]CAK1980567.1 hypothetical protein VCRA2113O412_20107 [Vibrio crassostreae]CAK1997188.1 hypothetical protein VCRA2117O428_20302 [Vibrio crassostreae]CAK1998425.1 hypothetical protein VCRA2119O430_20302 [Vibrio crassostreae]